MSIEEYRRIAEQYSHGRYTTSEHDLQKSCVQWFRYTYPKYAKLLMAIPNGGRRTKYERTQVLEEGLVAGCPDLMLPLSNGEYSCLFIEMKNGRKGVLSNSQKEIIKLLREHGNKVEVCRTFDDFVSVINTYLS